MFKRYRELDPKSKKRIQNLAYFLAIAALISAGYIEDALTPVVTLTDGAGQLDADTQYFFKPDDDKVVIVDGQRDKRIFLVPYGAPEHEIMIFHASSEMVLPADTLKDIRYKTVAESQKAQEIEQIKQAYPEASVEEQVVVTEGSGKLEAGVDYIFYPPKGQSVILDGFIKVVNVDRSVTYTEPAITVLQNGYGVGIGKDVYEEGRYEFVAYDDQEREIAERQQRHPNAHVDINK